MRIASSLLLGVLVLAPVAWGKTPDAEVVVVPSKKTLANYQEEYAEAKKKVDRVFTDKAFESTRFKDKKSGKVLKYSELPEFSRAVIKITVIESLSKSLTVQQEEMTDTLGKLKKVAEEKASEMEAAVANHTDVTAFNDKLFTLRQDVAKRYEEAATSFFNSYSDKFTKEEARGYLNQMKRFHDTQKLIERKKK